jgi:hypothetical protein
VKALRILAGPRALAQLRADGLTPTDVRVVPGAAGGPKGLILNPLDRFLFGQWLAAERPADRPLHLIGASIGAWRMAAAARPDPDAALATLAEDYIGHAYGDGAAATGRPSAQTVSAVFRANLELRYGGALADDSLNHRDRRLHVLTSQGQGPLRREHRWLTPAGYALAMATNLTGRPALGRWLRRAVFSDPRDALPFALDDFPTDQLVLDRGNLALALQASCSIPFWLEAVHDIPGAPPGAHWDGGITDYHLHLDYAGMTEGLVLYPHFQPTLVPGWLDKGLKRRHAATARLDNVIVLAPRPEWVASLPGAKLPDRNDFKTFAALPAERVRRWRVALAESRRLADELAEWLARGAPASDGVEPLGG